VLTTTITSFLPQGSGQSSAVPLTLTLTLNSTSPQAINETIANATMSGNDTLANGTMEWQEGDDWIPFNIIIDPAYGVLGALLILSGIPLAVLGGKNRWYVFYIRPMSLRRLSAERVYGGKCQNVEVHLGARASRGHSAGRAT
jgi:hypothetical protein